MRSGQSRAVPRSSGERSRPSSGFVLTSGTPARLASVGSRSIAPAICGTRVPGAIFPGQRMTNGARTPPSSVEPLRPFMPPFQRSVFGPLSEK